MASVNKVILIGNLGNDPEIKHFENGGAIARFSLATSESYTKKETGEKITNTEWHNIITRGGLATKVVEPYIKKGDSLYIEGRLKTRSWEDKSGNTRYTTEVICENLEMLGKRRSEDIKTPVEKEVDNNKEADDLPF
mgnify:FL=1